MKREHLAPGDLTPPNRIVIDYFAPDSAVADLVTTFYHFRCEDPVVQDIQPAGVGQLSLFPLGKGRMSLPGGGHDGSHEVNLLTPFTRAMPFTVAGPFHAIGAALSPLGWAALTGLDAREHGNRLYDAAGFLDPEIATRGTQLCADYRAGLASPADCIAVLSGMIVKHAQMPRPRDLALIAATGQWLASGPLPDVEALYAASSFSRRQTQRLVQRFFGASPVALRRKYRALRAAAVLAGPKLTPEQEGLLAESFYDQPHMIREIREFVGRTPARLGDPDSPYLNELIASKNLRELGS